MAGQFITEDFLLQTKTARSLYHEHAKDMPIYDYHCHLPTDKIAANHQFDNLTQIWLHGDHYKWRAMRANGVAEEYITGNADDYEKFENWAQTVPYCLCNPLYHWTHIELKRYFGLGDKLLNRDNAKEIYATCSEMLRTPQFSVRNILRQMGVKLICTTEEPLDSLEHHKKIRDDGFEIKVHAAFHPDKGLAVEDLPALNVFIDKLEEVCDMEITNFSSYIEALRRRHYYFHENGCRLSDYGLETTYAEDYTKAQIENIFNKISKDTKFNIVIFFSLLILSIFGILKRKYWLRNSLLLISIIYLGFWDQYYLSFIQVSHILLFKFSPFMNFIGWYILVMLVLFCTIFLGRVYCGWLCPFGTAQEFLYKIKHTAKIKLPHKIDTSFKKVKYILLFFVLIGVFITRNPYFANYEPFATSFNFSGRLWNWIFLGVILTISLAIYRPFCRCLCLIGAVQALISKLSPKKLKVSQTCNKCKICIKVCPIAAIDIGLEKRVKINSMECIRCELCKKSCPQKVIK